MANANSAKILNFLKQIRGLSQYSNEELEDYLWQCRFDLLFPRTSGNDGGRGCVPLFKDIPTPELLESLLLRDNHGSEEVAGGVQAVAHSLYPDSVPWPSSPLQATASPNNPRPVSPSGSKYFFFDELPAAALQSGSIVEDSHECSKPCAIETDQSPTVERPEARAAERDPPPLSSTRQNEERDPESLGRSSVIDQGLAEVILCGKTVNATVRGKTVQELTEDVANAVGQRWNDDVKYLAAKSKRMKLERALQLEKFQRRKLLDRIDCLERLKDAELTHQSILKKRETARSARKEELKLQLNEGFAKYREKEKADAGKEPATKTEFAEINEKWDALSKYHKEQKMALAKWHENAAPLESPADRVRARKAELLQQDNDSLARSQKNAVTVRQLEAENVVRRLHEGFEQRPPLPPIPLEKPQPVLQNGVADPPTNEKLNSHDRNWIPQAHEMSTMYGLTESDTTNIVNVLSNGIVGAGRLATSKPKKTKPSPRSCLR